MDSNHQHPASGAGASASWTTRAWSLDWVMLPRVQAYETRMCTIHPSYGRERVDSNHRSLAYEASELGRYSTPQFWWAQRELNPRHSVLHTDVLPTELQTHWGK